MGDGGHDQLHEADEEELAAARAYGEADYATARRHLQDAYRAHRERGRPARAALMAMELAELHSSLFGNGAAANGWLARARRLLEPLGDVVEWGYLELALMACDRPDVADLERSAERALAIARRFGDPDLEVRALADGGLALVCQGRLREGFALLDEALAAATAGECRPDTASRSMCSLLTSCDRAGDLRRVDEWNRLVEDSWLVEGGPTVLAEHCRMLRSGLLAAAGRWGEAEASLTALLAAMAPSAPHRVETMARLAELRLRRGELELAAGLIEPHQDAVAMCAPLAHLHLLRGETAESVAVAELGLRDLVADRLRGAPLLELIVRAELQRGDLAAADGAADRLAELAAGTDSDQLLASAHSAAGRVAAGRSDVAAAIDHFSHAVQGFEHSGHVVAAGVMRLELARMYATDGDAERAMAEARRVLALFERLGADPMTDEVRQLLRHLGARVRTRADAREAVAALTRREADVLDLVRQGLTNAEIGRRLFISAKTAEHHVGRVLTKLGVRSRTEAAALAAAARSANGVDGAG